MIFLSFYRCAIWKNSFNKKKKQKKKMKDVSFMHAIMDTKRLKRKKK